MDPQDELEESAVQLGIMLESATVTNVKLENELSTLHSELTHLRTEAQAFVTKNDELEKEVDAKAAALKLAIHAHETMQGERDVLREQVAQLISDGQTNSEISRMQAERIRGLLQRLGEPHAPNIKLPSNN